MRYLPSHLKRIRPAGLLLLFLLVLLCSGFVSAGTASAAGSYEQYRALVDGIEEKEPPQQIQLYRVDSGGGRITGICNVCSVTTLLNRRLAYDGKTDEVFTVKDVFDACGVTVKDGPRAWNGSDGARTGYVYSGDTGGWSRLQYTDGRGTSYRAVRVDKSAVSEGVNRAGNFSNYLIGLLHEHPEGVCIRNVTANHVAVVYCYKIINGAAQFYVKDPVKCFSGRAEEAWIYTANGVHSLYSGLDFLVYLDGSKAAPAPDENCRVHSTLKKGASGPEVKTLQQMLNTAMGTGLPADGSFGTMTLQALTAFQRQEGLTADGSCGPETWARLEEACKRKTVRVKVTFHPNGGSVKEKSRTIYYMGKIGKLPVPVRAGHVFDGWYTKKEGGRRVSASTAIAGKQTIYAHWTYLEITVQPPAGIVADLQESVQLSVKARGVGLSYQWQVCRDGSTWKKLRNARRVSVTADAKKDGWQFRCRVKNAEGAVIYSDPVTLTVAEAPLTVTRQPEDCTAEAGKTVTLRFAVEGSGLSYRWQYSADGSTWKGWSRAENAKVLAAVKRNGYRFRCIVTDACGRTVVSDTVTLTVK